MRDMGHEGRSRLEDGKDRDEGDQVDVWYYPVRNTEQRMRRGCGRYNEKVWKHMGIQ